MLIFDLKTGLFIGLLLLTGLVAGGWFTYLRFSAKWRKFPGGNLKQVFESLPFGIILLTISDSTILYSNPQGRRLLAELSENSNDPAKTLRQFEPRLAPGDEIAVQRSGTLHQPAFLRWWEYRLEHGKKLLILAEDGDQHRYARQQAFVGQLMHELRTPLTALVAHSEIIASAQASPAVRAASLQTVQSGAQRMARLVRDMLELYRLETADGLTLQPLNLVLLTEDAISQVILLAEEREVALNFEADMPLPLVLGHSDRLKQVFVNLVDNAIKYCRAGDKVLVKLQRRSEGVLCIVQDSGPGIPAAELPNVTRQLYRLHTSSEIDGTGLGLALVSEILRRHNSTLSIESSTEGATGTSCRWLLPYAPTL